MKTLLIYSTLGIVTAEVFDSRNQAVDYINNYSQKANDKILSLKTIRKDHYFMVLKNNIEVDIEIKNVEDNNIKYDLTYIKNGVKVETRRFKQKSNAMQKAHLILDELGYYQDSEEDKEGMWTINDELNNVKIILTMVIFDGLNEISDYRILGLDKAASIEEVKKAYHKKALKYHPDHGGNPEEFKKIKAAYDRILMGNNRGEKPKIVDEYSCVNITHLMGKITNKIKSTSQQNSTQPNNSQRVVLHEQARLSARKLLLSGGLFLFIGIFLTSLSHDNAGSDGVYTIFYGAILVGVWRIVKGIFYLIDPDAAIRMKK